VFSLIGICLGNIKDVEVRWDRRSIDGDKIRSSPVARISPFSASTQRESMPWKIECFLLLFEVQPLHKIFPVSHLLN
jgi:hypothetical protein